MSGINAKTMHLLHSAQPVEYCQAIYFMEERVNAIVEGTAEELVWFLEHDSMYTTGLTTNTADYRGSLPMIKTGRGGKITYHGPGQRVVYLMIDLRPKNDLRHYLCSLERWIISALTKLGMHATAIEGKTGVWIPVESRLKKLASIGIRVRRWVAFHGVAINLNPQMSHFDAISPCGLGANVMTSLHKAGVYANMAELDDALISALPALLEELR